MLSMEDARQMVADGDILLQEYRDHYKTTFGKDSSLNDDQLLEVVRQPDDDLDPEDWAKRMLDAEQAI